MSFSAVAYSSCQPVDSYSSDGSVKLKSVVERLTRSVPPRLASPELSELVPAAGPANPAATSSDTPIAAIARDPKDRLCIELPSGRRGEVDAPACGCAFES